MMGWPMAMSEGWFMGYKRALSGVGMGIDTI